MESKTLDEYKNLRPKRWFYFLRDVTKKNKKFRNERIVFTKILIMHLFCFFTT